MVTKNDDELEDTKPNKAYRFEENFSEDLLGLKAHRHTENFVQDMNDTQPVNTVRKPASATDLEDTKPRKISGLQPAGYFTHEPWLKVVKDLPTNTAPKPNFNWVAFFVMIFSIGAALLVGYFIPGPFDEFLTTVVISSVYGFLNAHDFKLKNIFKK